MENLANSRNGDLSSCNSDDQVARELASIVRFMRQDADHLVFRKFERLNLYNLLFLQHKLTAYDHQISALETQWNGPALAALLPELEPLVKRYSTVYTKIVMSVCINTVQMKLSYCRSR